MPAFLRRLWTALYPEEGCNRVLVLRRGIELRWWVVARRCPNVRAVLPALTWGPIAGATRLRDARSPWELGSLRLQWGRASLCLGAEYSAEDRRRLETSRVARITRELDQDRANAERLLSDREASRVQH